MTSLTDQNAIDAVALGDGGFLSSMRRGSLWIDVSTIDPTASVRHAEAATEAGVDRLDAACRRERGSGFKGRAGDLGGREQRGLSKGTRAS